MCRNGKTAITTTNQGSPRPASANGDKLHLAGRPRLAGWMAGWSSVWLFGWLASWPLGCLAEWLVGWLIGFFNVWLTKWLVGLLMCSLVGWVVAGWVTYTQENLNQTFCEKGFTTLCSLVYKQANFQMFSEQ